MAKDRTKLLSTLRLGFTPGEKQMLITTLLAYAQQLENDGHTSGPEYKALADDIIQGNCDLKD